MSPGLQVPVRLERLRKDALQQHLQNLLVHAAMVITDVACVIAPNLVEGRSYGLRTMCGEVAKQKAGFAAGHLARTRSSVYEVMRGLLCVSCCL